MLSIDYGNFSAIPWPAVYRLGHALSTTAAAWTGSKAGIFACLNRLSGRSILLADMTADLSRLSGKSIILVGLMGAGKTSVGRKLAEKLEMTFIDADEEIVKAAGCSVEDIFELYGEEAFRDVEERVIQRLLEEGPVILATGGGAFMNSNIRALIVEKGVSVWLRVELDVLVKRTRRRGGRPLLKNQDPKTILKKLMDERYPVYAETDIVVDSKDESTDVTVGIIAEALEKFSESPRQEARS
jgi:shikimate kinase